METVVVGKYVETAVALGARHAEEVHIAEIHVEEPRKFPGFVGGEKVGMMGYLGGIACICKVEIGGVGLVFDVRADSHEGSQSHHEGDMEICRSSVGAVKNLYGGGKVVEKQWVRGFLAEYVEKELSQEQCYH